MEYNVLLVLLVLLVALVSILSLLLLTISSVHFGWIDRFLVSRGGKVIDMLNDTDDECVDFKPLPLTAENVIKVATKMKEIYDNNHQKYTHLINGKFAIRLEVFNIINPTNFNIIIEKKYIDQQWFDEPQWTSIYQPYYYWILGLCCTDSTRFVCRTDGDYRNNCQRTFNEIQEFIEHGELHLDNKVLIYELMSKLEVETIDKLNPNLLEYINIDDAYYVKKGVRSYLFKFDDWSIVGVNDQPELLQSILTNYTNAICCEDPRKTHWKHFLEIEMKAKRKKQVDCHKFVDEILKKQVEYNDLQVVYEMLPSAPITDYETFENFCKLFREEVNHDVFEIQNYLLLKRSAK